MHKEMSALSIVMLLGLGLGLSSFAQQRAQDTQVTEPKSVVLLFREDFNSGLPNQLPLLPEHLTNPNLELKLYAQGNSGIDWIEVYGNPLRRSKAGANFCSL